MTAVSLVNALNANLLPRRIVQSQGDVPTPAVARLAQALAIATQTQFIPLQLQAIGVIRPRSRLKCSAATLCYACMVGCWRGGMCQAGSVKYSMIGINAAWLVRPLRSTKAAAGCAGPVDDSASATNCGWLRHGKALD